MSKNSRTQGGCWSTWCCPGRMEWFGQLAVGVVVTLSIAALVTSMWAWSMASFGTAQRLYDTNGVLTTGSASHVLIGPTPMAMELPNNLIEYVGALIHVDCGSPGPHTITLKAGTLVTTWDGTNRVVTCGVWPGAGFSFRVLSQSQVRLIDPRQVSFA